MKFTLELVATGITAVTAIGGGGLWLGAISNTNDQQDRRIEAVEQAPTDIRVLQESQRRVEQDIAEIKTNQKEILKELRK